MALQGQTLAFAGQLTTTHTEATTLAIGAGAKVTDEVGVNTTILVAGDAAEQQALGIAKANGIEVWTEEQFLTVAKSAALKVPSPEGDEADDGEAQEVAPPKKAAKTADHATADQPWVEWCVTEAVYRAASNAAAAIGYPNNERITFLLAKGVEDGPTVAPNGSFVSRFSLLVNPPKPGENDGPTIAQECQKWVDRRNALDRILGRPIVDDGESRGVKDVAAVPEDAFACFVQQHPEWKEGEGVFVCFRDHPSVRRGGCL